MRTYATSAAGQRVLVVVLDKGDEAIGCLSDAVRRHRITAAQVTAVGAFREAELGFFDTQKMDYERIPVDEQAEVLTLLGDVAEQEGEPALHLHAVLGRRDGSTVGGHLLRGEVWPTLEVIVTEVPAELAKHRDPQTGLALIRLPE
jgi:uncharacterized protein